MDNKEKLLFDKYKKNISKYILQLNYKYKIFNFK